MDGADLQPRTGLSEEELFVAVLPLEPAARTRFLQQRCPDDAQRRAVESLLAWHDRAGDALESPPPLARLASVAGAAEARDEQVPGRIGQYAIRGEFGTGGMGVVYLADGERPRRAVALKVIRAGVATASMIRRFELEGQVLGRLQHPGIAQIFEAGMAEIGGAQRPFFAMELVQGRPLTEHCAGAELPARARLELLAKVCDAVHHAHQKGVIHRDLKPGNILVDPAGQPKILDFGVARAVDADIAATMQTDPGLIVGTLAYMSPEQAAGDPRAVDTRADVYALGVMMYEMLAGRLPHDLTNKGVPEAVLAIRDTEPPKLSVISRVFKGDVATIAAKAMEKDRARRYQSASEMAADIRRYLRDEPIQARPPSVVYQFRKFAKRNTSLLAGLGTAAVLAAAVTTYAFVRISGERDRAVAAQEREHAQRERAQAVNSFLKRMVAFSDPDLGFGPDPTVREMLVWATAEIASGALEGQAEVEMDVCESLRSSYVSLGLYASALPHAERVARLRGELLGETHPDTLVSIRKLVFLYGQAGRNDEALALVERALEASRRVYGEEGDETLSCLLSKGNILMRLGRASEAEPLELKVLAHRRATRGDDDLDTALAMWELGAVYRDQKRYADALPLYEHALAVVQRIRGDSHHTTVRLATGLAREVYMPLGRKDDARQLLRATIDHAAPTLGLRHPEVMQARFQLCELVRTAGRLEEVEKEYRSLIADVLAEKGPCLQGATMQIRLAWTLEDLGRAGEAVAPAREACATRSALAGATAIPTLRARAVLGAALVRAGQPAEAERELRQALRDFEEAESRDNYRWVAMSALGEALAAQDRLDEALPLAEEALSRLKGLGEDHRQLIEARRRVEAIRAAMAGRDP
jgi:serine/threonine protein kinase